MSAALSAPRSAFRLLLGLFAVAICLAAVLADPASAAAAVPNAGPLALSDPSWLDGYTLHAVGLGGMAAAVAVPKGTIAKVRAAIKSFLGESATDADIDAALAAELGEGDPVVTPPPAQTPPDSAGIADVVKQAVEAALAPVKAELDTVKGALQTEAEGRVAAQKAVETQQATERATSIETLLDAAVKDGRIVPAKRDEWKTRLEGGYDTVKPILDELAPNPALARAAGKVSPDTSGAKTGDKPAAERPAPGSMTGSLPANVLKYLDENVASN